MALKKTVTTINGFQAEDAYHRVEGISIVGKEIINFTLASYKDGSNEFPAFQKQQHSCAYNFSKENPFVQAYNFCKSLPELVGATDC